MNYIVFDLEWNHPQIERRSNASTYDKSESNVSKLTKKVEDLPFEIIEIGAVKLSHNRKWLSHFSEMIRPQVYTEMNDIIQDIVKVDIRELEKKDTFDNVVKRFFKWCGKEFIFCTWGSMDLTELQRNMEYYNINKYINEPIKYCDVQKLFALQFLGHKDLQSLESAIDFFDLKKDKKFHRAYIDAKYTSEIFRRIDTKYVNKYFSIDIFHNPKKKEDAITVNYDTYSKYISCEYDSKEEAMEDKDINEVLCYQCSTKAYKKVDWFCSNPKLYCCVAECKTHGLLKAKARVKKKKDGKLFIVKTITSTDLEGYQDIKNRQLLIRAKRKAKRKRKKVISAL